MTEHFDSRALRHTDTFGQRFMKPGTYRYALTPAVGDWGDPDFPYVVEVTEPAPRDHSGKGGAKAEMGQTDVSISLCHSRFTPDQEKVVIQAGDLVLWHCPDAHERAYAVRGEKSFFSSDNLTNECGYSHLFTTPGEHVWEDANGSGLSGVIRVTDPVVESKRAFGAWQRQLREGTLVMISEGKAEPAEVEITLGQMVFFAVVTGTGVSVTERAPDLKEPWEEPPSRTRHLAGASFFRSA